MRVGFHAKSRLASVSLVSTSRPQSQSSFVLKTCAENFPNVSSLTFICALPCLLSRSRPGAVRTDLGGSFSDKRRYVGPSSSLGATFLGTKCFSLLGFNVPRRWCFFRDTIFFRDIKCFFGRQNPSSGNKSSKNQK